MGVKLEKLIEKMSLKNLTPDLDLTQSEIQVPDINRPALQLTGYFDHFDSDRVHIWKLFRTRRRKRCIHSFSPMGFRVLYIAEIWNRMRRSFRWPMR